MERVSPNEENFSTVPIELTVAVGKTQISINDLLSLEKNSVVKLDRRLDDPIEIFVSGRLVAHGQLELLENDSETKLGVRILSLVGVAGVPRESF